MRIWRPHFENWMMQISREIVLELLRFDCFVDGYFILHRSVAVNQDHPTVAVMTTEAGQTIETQDQSGHIQIAIAARMTIEEAEETASNILLVTITTVDHDQENGEAIEMPREDLVIDMPHRDPVRGTSQDDHSTEITDDRWQQH
jgi:hypothetical protein